MTNYYGLIGITGLPTPGINLTRNGCDTVYVLDLKISQHGRYHGVTSGNIGWHARKRQGAATHGIAGRELRRPARAPLRNTSGRRWQVQWTSNSLPSTINVRVMLVPILQDSICRRPFKLPISERIPEFACPRFRANLGNALLHLRAQLSNVLLHVTPQASKVLFPLSARLSERVSAVRPDFINVMPDIRKTSIIGRNCLARPGCLLFRGAAAFKASQGSATMVVKRNSSPHQKPPKKSFHQPALVLKEVPQPNF